MLGFFMFYLIAKKNKLRSLASIMALSAIISGTNAIAQETSEASELSGLDKAIKEGTILFDARLRYSFADFGSLDENANGVTYRIRAGFETGKVADTKLLVDFDYIRSLNDDFNSTINGNTQFPVVADPDVTELNRLQLTNTSISDTKITLGRQRIIQDDARFIGNVGWRQNEQTYDALRVENTSIKNLKIDISYLDQINRIFGDDSPQGRFESDSYLIHAKYKFPSEKIDISFRSFAYLLDFENDNVAALAARLSTQTYGGGISLAKGPVFLDGVYANQTPFGENAASFDLNYYSVSGGFKKSGFLAKGGYEVLGGDGALGFVTPLATAHKFNGFADVFLATPSNGLSDLYGQIGYTAKGVGPFALLALNLFYHDFSAEEGGVSYGDEVDVLFVSKLKAAKRMKFLVKYANFNSNGFAQDVQRLTVEANFTF